MLQTKIMCRATVAVYLLVCAINAEYFTPVDISPTFFLNFNRSSNNVCTNNTELLKENLKNHTLWAYRLWDATAKHSVGVTEGSIYQLGHYDECLSIEEPYLAQYCLTTVNYKFVLNGTILDPYSLEYRPYEAVYNKLYNTNDPNKVRRDIIYWGLCVPVSCSPTDIQYALQEYLDRQENAHISKYDVQVKTDDCYTQNNTFELTLLDYSFGIIVFCLIMTVAISTIIHVRYYSGNESEEMKKKKSVKLLLCFSAKQNFNDLSKADSPNKALSILYGVKCLMLCAVVVAHSIINMLTAPVFNTEFIEQINRGISFMTISRGEILIDWYFSISGILVTYAYLSQAKKKRINPIQQIILRYFRIAPVLLFITFFYATILYKLGSGPMWNKVIGAEKHFCEENWWTNMLLMSNLIDVNNLCILQGWYVSADFQMFILSIPLNVLIQRNSKRCWMIFSSVLCIFILIPFLVQYLGNKDPIVYVFHDVISTVRFSDYFVSLYIPFYTRAAPYIIGMIFGFIYYELRDSKFKLSMKWSFVIGVCAILVQLACSYGGVVFYNPYSPPGVVVSSLYVALNRPAFATASCTILLLMSYGTLPILSQFLSWSAFIPFAKLSFGTYMVHFGFQLTKAASTRTPQTLTVYYWMATALFEITVSQFVALGLYILIETPISKLMKELIPSDLCGIRSIWMKTYSSENVLSSV